MDLSWDWTWQGKKVKTDGTQKETRAHAQRTSRSTGSARTGDEYGISSRLSDPLGAYVTHKQNIDAVQPIPPRITRIQGTSSLREGQSFWLSVSGQDPDGNDDNLRWSFSGDGSVSNVSDRGASGRALVRAPGRGGRSQRITVTDEQGLSASTTHLYGNATT